MDKKLLDIYSDYLIAQIRRIEQEKDGVLILDDSIEEKPYTDENESVDCTTLIPKIDASRESTSYLALFATMRSAYLSLASPSVKMSFSALVRSEKEHGVYKL